MLFILSKINKMHNNYKFDAMKDNNIYYLYTNNNYLYV